MAVAGLVASLLPAASLPASAPANPAAPSAPAGPPGTDRDDAAVTGVPDFGPDDISGEELSRREAARARKPGLISLQAVTFDPRLHGEPVFPSLFRERTRERPERGYFLLQFEGPIQPWQRAALLSQGVRIVQHVPNNACVVRGSASVFEAARTLPFVRWSGRFQPGYKAQRDLVRRALGPPRPDDGPGIRLRVALFPGEDAAAVAAEAGASGAEVLEVSPHEEEPLLVVRTRGNGLGRVLRELTALEAVSFVEAVRDMAPANDHSIWVGQSYDTVNGPLEAGGQEYPLSGTVWKRDLLGQGQIIGLADSGVDRNSCQFRTSAGCPVTAQSVPAPGDLATVPNGKIVAYNVLPGAVEGDETGHGSHTGGTLAGDAQIHPSTTTSAGHDSGDGMAPQARIVVEDIGSPFSRFFVGTPPRVSDLWAQEYNAGARIASNSWGADCSTPPCSYYGTNSALTDRFVVDHPEMLIVFAAGNSGSAERTLDHVDKNVLTVGATTNGGSPDRANGLAAFSSRGPATDGRIKPDLTAPGMDIVSAYGASSAPACASSLCGYRTASGTSMACPTVAGLAALVRQYYMEGWFPTGLKDAVNAFVPSAALVKATLLNGAMNMTGSGVTGDAPNVHQGWGRVQLDNALLFGDDVDLRGVRVWDVEADKGLATGESDAYPIQVLPNQPLKVTLVWTDPPGAPFAGRSLVNDLDLELEGPSGSYRGNVWNNAVDTVANGDRESRLNAVERDNLNNVEGILVAHPVPGGYRIRVRGGNVPEDARPSGAAVATAIPRQGYALVVTGDLRLAAGTPEFDARSYSCGSPEAKVRVLVQAGAAMEMLTVSNNATGDVEPFFPTPTGPYIEFTIPLDFDRPAVAHDGRLQVASRSQITATYADFWGATAQALIDPCAPPITLHSVDVSGGCDFDGYLDANETVQVAVRLGNEGTAALAGVRGRLTSLDRSTVVLSDWVDFDAAAPGAEFANTTPILVAARSVTAGDIGHFRLELKAGDFPEETDRNVDVVLEQDRVTRTAQSPLWTFSGGSDLSPPCAEDPAARWTTIHSPGPQTNAIVSQCDPNAPSLGVLAMSATLPSACGTLPQVCANYGDESSIYVFSPVVPTTPPGTTLLSARPTRLDYKIRAQLPSDSYAEDVFEAGIMDAGGSIVWLVPTILRKGNFQNNFQWWTVGLDLTGVDFSDLIDPSTLQVVFFLGTRDSEPPGASSTSTGTVRIDDVRLTFSAEGRGADVSACAPSCTAPPAPAGLNAVADPEGIRLQWPVASGVGQYHLFRGTNGCGNMQPLTELPGSWLAYTDRDAGSGTILNYELRAADASGVCESAPSACVAATRSNGTCFAAPIFNGAIDARSRDEGACGIEVSYGAAIQICGGLPRYNIYRSPFRAFTPSPGNLLATTSLEPFVDTQLGSLAGACYIVRAVDDTGREDDNTEVRCAATSGPKTSSTLKDDAETAPFLDLGYPWTRSPAMNHTTSGSWSYHPGFSGAYPPQTCGVASTREIELMPIGPSSLSFWTTYNLEHQWDGMVVEVSRASTGYSDWALLGPAASYPADFSQTGACAVGSHCPGAAWCNACCFPPTTPAFNGPAGNSGLTPWTQSSFDLGAYAGERIKLRFDFSSDAGTEFQGLYLDDIAISGVARSSSCAAGACSQPPVFYGLIEARDLGPAVPGVRLKWSPPLSWGSGGPGQFLVFRDGVQLATLITSATSFDDLAPPAGVAHLYQVVAVSACGLRDGNSTFRTATDCGAAATGGADLHVAVDAQGEDVVLTWVPPADARATRVLWRSTDGTIPLCPGENGASSAFVDLDAPASRFVHPVGGDGRIYVYDLVPTSGPACGAPVAPACP